MIRMCPFMFQTILESKSIKFQSVGFLQNGSSSLVQYTVPLPQTQQIYRCQHCDWVGHVKDQCFDLHPCEHCGKRTHHLDTCSRHDSCKNGDLPWMDHILAMGFNNQEDISVILQSSFSSIDTSCSCHFFIFSHFI